jgi:hypothetical protein
LVESRSRRYHLGKIGLVRCGQNPLAHGVSKNALCLAARYGIVPI